MKLNRYFFSVTTIGTRAASVAVALCSLFVVPRSFACEWVQVPGPPPVVGDIVHAIAGVANDDLWAVGNTASVAEPLTEHWDGVSWSVVPSQGVRKDHYLTGIAALDSNDVWAVGWDKTGGARRGSKTLVEHWNGDQWTAIRSPNMPGDSVNNYLRAVSAVSPNDVWAVGYYDSGSNLVTHWDGSTWRIVPSPFFPQSALLAVDAIATNDAWAVGYMLGGTFTLHWDGVAWSVVPSPNGPGSTYFRAVAAVAHDDVWAVGNLVGDSTVPIAAHWDGATWSLVATPPVGDPALLLDVVAICSNDVWAVGVAGEEALTEHWDGTAWSVVPTPSLPDGGYLESITAIISARGKPTLWATGHTGENQLFLKRKCSAQSR